MSTTFKDTSGNEPPAKDHTRLFRRISVACLVVGVCMVISAIVWHSVHHETKSFVLGPTPLPAHPYTLPAPVSVGNTKTSPNAPVVTRTVPPGHVSIPSLKVTAPLIAEPISGNQLDIPSDVHDVGVWSGGGSITGTQGTVLLAGHVNWWNQGNGALYDLASIQPGATIYVRAPTGITTTWQVVALHAYLKADLPQTIFAPTGQRRLVVVTCGGAYDPTTGHYADNVVAAAVPEPTSPTPIPGSPVSIDSSKAA